MHVSVHIGHCMHEWINIGHSMHVKCILDMAIVYVYQYK